MKFDKGVLKEYGNSKFQGFDTHTHIKIFIAKTLAWKVQKFFWLLKRYFKTILSQKTYGKTWFSLNPSKSNFSISFAANVAY